MINILPERKKGDSFPIQFWLLFWGTLVNRAGVSMIWPFVTIYMRDKLDLSLTAATMMFTVQSVASLIGVGFVGVAMDRFGRKNVLVISMFLSALVLLGMAASNEFGVWFLLIALYGAVNPVFFTGVNTMIADMIPEEGRISAYALIRMVANAGISIGPIIGGLLASISFELIYQISAGVYIGVAVLIILLIRETLSKEKLKNDETSGANPAGYGFLLTDRVFLLFFTAYLLVELCATQIFVLLPVYSSENFGLTVRDYTWFFTLNAAMVVVLQYAVTRVSRRYLPISVMIFGAVLYALGVGSVSLGSTMLAFLLSMAVMTMGELLLAPTATAFMASHAPMAMRGRYMSIFGLGYTLAAGIGPVIGGIAADSVGQVSIWLVGGAMGGAGAALFWYLKRYLKTRKTSEKFISPDAAVPANPPG